MKTTLQCREVEPAVGADHELAIQDYSICELLL